MDLSALSDVLATVGIFAKEIGKGGGGSTEEPTVCISLLPVALGVIFVVVRRAVGILGWPGGRTAAPHQPDAERKVQTA